MIEKEVRALLPAWTAGILALAAARSGVYPLNYLGLPLYFIAVAALGAFSIGHEYVHGTLGFSLTLPVARWRIWVTKLGVLLPMIVTLALIAAWQVDLDRGERAFGGALFWLAALAAFCIAPWLTMLTQSPLAGTMFTMGLVGGSLALGERIGVARYGYTADVDRFRVAFMWWTIGGLSFVGAVVGWRMFARLEAVGRHGSDVQLLTARPARAVARSAAGRRRRVAALFSKELRLQQLPLVLAVIYVAGSLATGLAGRRQPEAYGVLAVLTGFYMLVLPAVIGSLATAEEWHFGTHDAQLILPMAVSHQWFVKTATAIALSLLLALLLPNAVTGIFPLKSLGGFAPRGFFEPKMITQVVASACIGLYVSTLTRDGITAVMYAIGAMIGVGYFTLRIGLSIAERVFEMTPDGWHRYSRRLGPLPVDVIWYALLAGFVLVVLRLALTNYRYNDRSPARLALHAAAVIAAMAAYAAAYGVVGAL